jgi:hypothetical protein
MAINLSGSRICFHALLPKGHNLVISGNAENIIDTNRIMILVHERIDPVRTNASPEFLRQVLNEPFTKSHKLSDFIGSPELITPGVMSDFIDTKLTCAVVADARLPLEDQIEYGRRMHAATWLFAQSDDDALSWFVGRKEEIQPLLLDAVIWRSSRVLSKEMTQAKRAKWKELLDARNPFCRLLAIKFLEQWVTQSDLDRIVTQALSDEYFWVQRTVLDKIEMHELKVKKETLNAYAEKEINSSLKKDYQEKLRSLKSKAKELASKL